MGVASAMRLAAKAEAGQRCTMRRAAVIGAGLLGAAAAFHLARGGWRVSVLSEGPVAGGASGASFGWINASFYHDPAHHRLRAEGIAAHHRLAAVGLAHWQGCIWHETAGAQQAAFAAQLRALGYPVEPLTRAEVARRLPALAAPEAALFLPSEGAVDAAAQAAALLQASGAEVWTGVSVQAIAVDGGRATAVVTAAGRVAADCVVLAAGTGTPALLAPLGIALPMLARPGVLVRTRPVRPVLAHILCGPGGEVRQLPSGHLLAPAAVSHQGDSAERIDQTPEALARATVARLAALLPGTDLVAEWEGQADRPVPGDGLPVLGEALPGLIVAVMHSGVTLGPLAGEAVAALADGRGAGPLWAPFAPGRFAV